MAKIIDRKSVNSRSDHKNTLYCGEWKVRKEA